MLMMRTLLWAGIVVAGSSIAGHILYHWVEKAAFQGFSKSHIKRLKKEYSFWKRITLLYLIRLCDSKRVNRRIFVYWIYWLASIGLGFIIGRRESFSELFLRGIVFMWSGTQVVIYLLWRYQWSKS